MSCPPPPQLLFPTLCSPQPLSPPLPLGVGTRQDLVVSSATCSFSGSYLSSRCHRVRCDSSSVHLPLDSPCGCPGKSDSVHPNLSPLSPLTSMLLSPRPAPPYAGLVALLVTWGRKVRVTPDVILLLYPTSLRSLESPTNISHIFFSF